MLTVHVKLYGTLRQYRPQTADGAPHHPFSVSLPPDATVTAVAEALGIPEGLMAVYSLNGESVDPDTPLLNEAKVNLFPPTAGGA